MITGILRIARESIFSGLNNLGVYTLLEPRFATAFGFTEPEVRDLLTRAGRSDALDEVQRWYNDYAAELCASGAAPVHALVIAFDGKDVRVRSAPAG